MRLKTNLWPRAKQYYVYDHTQKLFLKIPRPHSQLTKYLQFMTTHQKISRKLIYRHHTELKKTSVVWNQPVMRTLTLRAHSKIVFKNFATSNTPNKISKIVRQLTKRQHKTIFRPHSHEKRTSVLVKNTLSYTTILKNSFLKIRYQQHNYRKFSIVIF